MSRSPAVALELVRFVTRHPATRGGRVGALARLLRWQAARMTGARRALVTLGPMRLYCYPGSTGASGVLYVGLPEWEEMSLLLRVLRPGDGFVDVGANIGSYTVMASTFHPGVAVIAVEPARQTVARLEENLALNRLTGVRVFHGAVGAAEGSATFTRGRDTENRLALAEDVDVETVPVTTLDRLVGDAPVALVKIDVEGAELGVLRGAGRLLARAEAPVLLFEFIPEIAARFGTTFGDLKALLDRAGYRMLRYDADAGRLSPFDPATPDAPHNVVATRDPAALERRLAAGAAAAPRPPVGVRFEVDRSVESA